MKSVVTSAAVFAMLVVGISAASACELYKQQSMASVVPAPSEETQPVAATQVDSIMLAYLDDLAKQTSSTSEPTTPAE